MRTVTLKSFWRKAAGENDDPEKEEGQVSPEDDRGSEVESEEGELSEGQRKEVGGSSEKVSRCTGKSNFMVSIRSVH